MTGLAEASPEEGEEGVVSCVDAVDACVDAAAQARA